MTEQTVEEITGYRVRIEVDGKIISLESKRPRNMGERVEINRKTTYSLR
jgi:membrane protein implicated in regulation of membrane protease activity